MMTATCGPQVTNDCIADERLNLAEAPLWSPRRRALYWLDIALRSRLFEWSAATRQTRSWSVNELATGLAVARDGSLILVSESGVGCFDTHAGVLRPLISPPFSMARIRFNDCGCDPSGRLWTGTMWNDLRNEPAASSASSQDAEVGQICRFDSDRSCHRMESSFGCPNTFVWSLDNRTLLTADSAAGVLYAYRFDLATGAIADRRVFAAPAGLGVPDGSAMDAEGYLWNARWGAGCVARFAPDGTLTDTVRVPADNVTSCAFGGDDLDTLFVTTARQGLDESALARQPRAGGVFAFKAPVPGIPPGQFAITPQAHP